MSSQASFVSVATAQAQDAVSATYNMQVVGSRYEATPTNVTDTQIRGFQIDAYGKIVPTGAAADNAARVGNPFLMGGGYNTTLPTYDNGDQTTFQTDSRGRLYIVDDQALTQLTAIAASLVNVESYTDGLEGFTDGIEGLIATTNASLANLETYTDGLETLLATTNTSLAALEGYTDTLEALIAATNASLSALEGYTDAVETKLDSLIAEVQTMQGYVAPQTMTSGGQLYVDYSSTNLPGNASNPLELIAALPTEVRTVQLWDTGGVPFELMVGAAAAETRLAVFGPGCDGEFHFVIPAATRVSVRRLDSASALAGGTLCINFAG